jgi:hypothetical protein
VIQRVSRFNVFESPLFSLFAIGLYKLLHMLFC